MNANLYHLRKSITGLLFSLSMALFIIGIPYEGICQIVKTITTSDFDRIGNKILISFNIPAEDNAYEYNVKSAYIISADYGTIEMRTKEGNLQDLKPGNTEPYQFTWDVFQDVDNFNSPTSARINLEYNDATAMRVQKIEAIQEQQETKKTKKKNRNKKKPFYTIGLVARGGLSHFIGQSDVETPVPLININGGNWGQIQTYPYGHDIGAALEIRLSNAVYLKGEACVAARKWVYSYGGERVDILLNDYRINGGFKFGPLLLGGYVTQLQSAGLKSGSERLDLSLDMFKNDYGLTIGLESRPRRKGKKLSEDNSYATRNILWGIGYELSLLSAIEGSPINRDFTDFGPNSFQVRYLTSETVKFNTGFAYLKFGIRF